MTKAQQ